MNKRKFIKYVALSAVTLPITTKADYIFGNSFECPPVFATSIVADLKRVSDAIAYVEPSVDTNCPNMIII